MDDQLAEWEWLRRREEDPGAPPPSPAIARAYAELEGLLAELPSLPAEEEWQDEVLRRAASLHHRRRGRQRGGPPERAQGFGRRSTGRAMRCGAASVALAAALVLTMARQRSAPRELAVAIVGDALVRSESKAAVGQRLVVKAHPDDAAELRVYRDPGVLVARCPNGHGCRSRAGGRALTLEVELHSPVPHHIILTVGAGAPLPDAPMDAYIDAAGAARGRVRYERIEVH